MAYIRFKHAGSTVQDAGLQRKVSGWSMRLDNFGRVVADQLHKKRVSSPSRNTKKSEPSTRSPKHRAHSPHDPHQEWSPGPHDSVLGDSCLP